GSRHPDPPDVAGENLMAFLAPLAIPLAIGGTALSAYGSLRRGMFQAQVARNNAKIAGQNAEYARESGQAQAALGTRKGAAEVAKIKTAIAANNIDVNSGSAVDVIAGETEANKLDAETVLHNSDLQAYGYTTQAESFKAQAKEDETSGWLNAASDLL